MMRFVTHQRQCVNLIRRKMSNPAKQQEEVRATQPTSVAVPTEIIGQYSINQIMLGIAPYTQSLTMVVTGVGILLYGMHIITVLEEKIKATEKKIKATETLLVVKVKATETFTDLKLKVLEEKIKASESLLVEKVKATETQIKAAESNAVKTSTENFFKYHNSEEFASLQKSASVEDKK